MLVSLSNKSPGFPGDDRVGDLPDAGQCGGPGTDPDPIDPANPTLHEGASPQRGCGLH